MQGERSILESFPETIDLNQGSVPSNAAADQSAVWDHLINPVENRLSNYMLSSGVGSVGRPNTVTHNNSRAFSSWDSGESSSRVQTQDQVYGDDMKPEHDWASSLNICSLANERSQERGYRSSNLFLHDSGTNGYGSNPASGRIVARPISGSTHPLSVNLSTSNEEWQGTGTGTSQNLFKSGRHETEQFSTFGTPSEDIGTSSGSSSYMMDHDEGSGSSLGSWGLSCKRKALEGTSGQSYFGGSSSSNPQPENMGRLTAPAPYNASSSLTISPPPINLSRSSRGEQINSRTDSSTRGFHANQFSTLSSSAVAENTSRNLGLRANGGHQEPIPFDFPTAGNSVRHPSLYSTHHPSRSFAQTDSPELRPPTSLPSSSNHQSQPHLAQVPGFARSIIPHPWNGSLTPRSGGSASSVMISGDRSAFARDGPNFSSSLRISPDSLYTPPETRNLVQDPTSWTLATGNTSSSRNIPSSSRNGPSSSAGAFPTVWMPHQNSAATNQQRLPETTPWTLFPPVEHDSGGQRGHFSPFSSAPSSSEETAISSGPVNRGNHQPYSRSAILMEVSADEINGWRSLASDLEGRQRLIRQVLNAMRRNENFRSEDYMLFDPFVDGVDLHDRHRDMRLDVDNMSYEELLALEERIGNVSTGLTEETILQHMKQRNYQPLGVGTLSSIEPCCICQEEYTTGAGIGILDCGHEFHTDCIKQWLTLKNLCPICKMTALAT